MPNDRKWLNDLVRAEKNTLTLDRPLRAEMTSERTLINLTALNRQYKLGRAYANVRNLGIWSKSRAQTANLRRVPQTP